METREQSRLNPEQYAWELFRYWQGKDDRQHFRDAYLGHYESRAAFGEHLLEETYAASERLQRLPASLRAYVRLDAEQVVTDWERAGHFIVAACGQAEDEAGVVVFDRHGLGKLDRA